MLDKIFIQATLNSEYDQMKGIRRRYFTGDSEPVQTLKKLILPFDDGAQFDILVILDTLFDSRKFYTNAQSATYRVFLKLLSKWLAPTSMNHGETIDLLKSLHILRNRNLLKKNTLELVKQHHQIAKAHHYSTEILIALHTLDTLFLLKDLTLIGLTHTKNPTNYVKRCIAYHHKLTITEPCNTVIQQLLADGLFSLEILRQLCLHPEHDLIVTTLHALQLESISIETLNLLLNQPFPMIFKQTLTLLLHRNTPINQHLLKHLSDHRNPLELATTYQILRHNEILPQPMLPVIQDALFNTPYPAELLKVTTHLFRLQLLNQENCTLVSTNPNIEYLSFIIEKLITARCLHVTRLFKLSTHQLEENQFILQKLLEPQNSWLLTREAREEVWRQLPNRQLHFTQFNELLRRLGPPNTIIYYVQRLIEIDIEQRQRELDREALQREAFIHNRHTHVLHFFDLVREADPTPPAVNVAIDEYNPRQSTHTASVNESVTLSANRLKNSYLHLITTSDQISQTLKHIQNLIKNSKQGTDYTRAAALRCFNRITKDLTYVHKPSDCSPIQLLALLYHAILDDSKRIGDFENAESALIEGLYEAQRQENISKGHPHHSFMYNDEPACANGVFNKLINLMHGHHADCSIIYITPMTISEKLRCVVETRIVQYLNSLPNPNNPEELNSRLTLLNEIINPMHGIECLWSIIENDVTKEMNDTFSSRAHQAILDEIMPHAKDIVMPKKKIEPIKIALKARPNVLAQRLG